MDRRPQLAVSPRRLRPRTHRVALPPLAPSAASSVKTPPGSIKKATPMRASICAIPSPVRPAPSPMRASISALPSPIRAEPSPMRASVTALPSAAAARLDLTTTRAKLDFPAAAGKENIPAAPPSPPPPARGKASDNLPAAFEDPVALDLAALAQAASPAAGPLFVRGRLYDLYSARRNERLKRKHGFPYGAEWEVSPSPEAMAEDPCVAVELSRRRGVKKASTGAESAMRRSVHAGYFAADRAGGVGSVRSSLRSSKEMKKASAASGAVSMALKERRVNPRSSALRF